MLFLCCSVAFPPLFTTSNRSNLLRSYSATKLQMQHHSELSYSFLELHLEFKNAYFSDDNIHVVLLLLRPFLLFLSLLRSHRVLLLAQHGVVELVS